MKEISIEEKRREERDLVHAINQNNEKLSDLWGNLNGLRNMRETYNLAKEKCSLLANKMYFLASQHMILSGAATVFLYLGGHPIAGNVVLEFGLLSAIAYPVIYQLKTKQERKTIKDIENKVLNDDDEITASEKLKIEECRLKNAIGRRWERSESLNNDLRAIRGEKVETNYERHESPVIGETISYTRTK